jgi:hypothetical protein
MYSRTLSDEEIERYHSSVKLVLQRSWKTLKALVLTTVGTAVALFLIAGTIVLFEYFWKPILVLLAITAWALALWFMHKVEAEKIQIG